MSDTFGILPIPLVAPAAGEAVADPLLSVALSYFAAVLNANAPAAWQSVYRDVPTAAVVKKKFAADPQNAAIDNAFLPALFLSRESAADPVRIADDWLVQESVLRLYWILPIGVLKKRDTRDTMINGVVKVLLQAVERCRDPAWVVTGDPDARAAAQGSLFSTFGGWMDFTVGAWKQYTLIVQVTGGAISTTAEQPRYEGVSIACKVTERLNEDLTRFDPIGALDLTLTTPDGLVLGQATIP